MIGLEKKIHDKFKNLKKIESLKNVKAGKYYLLKDIDDILSIFQNIVLRDVSYKYGFYITKIESGYTVESKFKGYEINKDFKNKNDVIKFLEEQYTFKNFLNTAFEYFKKEIGAGEFKEDIEKFTFDYSFKKSLCLEEIENFSMVKLFTVEKNNEFDKITVKPLKGLNLLF